MRPFSAPPTRRSDPFLAPRPTSSFARPVRQAPPGRTGFAVPPVYKQGGVVEKSGYAFVHKGEGISPSGGPELKAMKKSLAGTKRGVAGKAGYRPGPKRAKTEADFKGGSRGKA